MISSALGTYRLGPGAPQDRELLDGLRTIDDGLAARHGIPEENRACGVFDLEDLRLAMILPDRAFYGASVPKICILLAFFDAFPEAVHDLDPSTERDLQAMIKRSDNEIASRYSRKVGLEHIQSLQLSDRYRLYDREHGGGLWCGKHYGIDSPRTGDPIHGWSHAATVRQCLRFYLMLEQGRLVNRDACNRIRQIFEAPELEFHNEGFVAGLSGRPLAMIRKDGWWEGWHLDTARVAHGSKVYLLAGMVFHPRGWGYLRGLAAEVDTLLCGQPLRRPMQHTLQIHRRSPAGHGPGANAGANSPIAGATYQPLALHSDQTPDEQPRQFTSPVIAPGHPFNDVLMSWNITAPPGVSVTFELRVGHAWNNYWTPFLHVGDLGPPTSYLHRQTECSGARVDVDYVRSHERYNRAQYRIAIHGAAETGVPRIEQVSLCLSDTTGLPDSGNLPLAVAADAADMPGRECVLAVPARSQKTEPKERAPRVCSPTSVAMVLEYHGVNRPTGEVVKRVHDPIHDIYGNWPRTVQVAWEYGMPGVLARFACWEDVGTLLAAGIPVIASIRVEEGQLTGAPFARSGGHLLVITGLDDRGNVFVNDPAAEPEDAVPRVYRADEMETVWFHHGGTAYVFLPQAPASPDS